MNLHEKAKPQCLFSAEQLQARIQTLGQEIAQDYDGKPLLLLGMLKGASVFLSDLIRAVPIPVAIDFMRLQSYGAGTISSGQVTCLLEPSMPLQQYHVLLVEDILDTGRTLQTALPMLLAQHPLSLKLCTLLDKPDRRIAPLKADYCGFTIPDLFVVGYGLDYAEQYRDLPYVGILKEWSE